MSHPTESLSENVRIAIKVNDGEEYVLALLVHKDGGSEIFSGLDPHMTLQVLVEIAKQFAEQHGI